MTPRFFSSEPIEPPRGEIGGSEAHHLMHVLRLGVGDRVTLFDGSGAEYSAHIQSVSRDSVCCEVEEKRVIDRELRFDLQLAVALPKGDRSRWLVEKAVELGVRQIIPIECTRSVAQVRAGSLARLEKAVIEASKQCGRNRLAEVREPISFTKWIEQEAGATIRLVADLDPEAISLHSIDHPTSGDTVQITIGPEGGFTKEEVAEARAGAWQVVSLGHRRLRVETAALAAVAAIGLWSPDSK